MSLFSQDIADNFCQDKIFEKTMTHIKSINSFAEYQEDLGYFKIFEEDEYNEFVYKYIKVKLQKNITTSMVKDIIKLIKWTIYTKLDNTQSKYIAFNDKLYNTRTNEFEKFDIKKKTFFRIGINSSDLKGEPVRFKQFLDEVIVDEDGKPDKEVQHLLQEMAGFYLIPDNLKGHKMFFLYGDGANGKSVFLDVLRDIIGMEFVCSMSIETLTTDKFSVPELAGKRVNICNEEESKFLRSDKFKALVSGDPVSAQKKYGDSFTMIPTTKYLFATNKIPSFDGINVGIKRRILIIPFNKEIEEDKRDPDLTEKLLKEKAEIVAWALEGMKRFVGNNYKFSKSKQTTKMMEDFENNMSSAILYIREQCTEDSDSFMTYDNIYQNYATWCEIRGKKKMSYYNFKYDIKRILLMPSVSKYDSVTKKTGRGRLLNFKQEEFENMEIKF